MSEQKQDGQQVLVNDASFELLGKVFEVQDDFENPSKFSRAFLHDAITSHAKALCNRAVAAWERAVEKYSQDNPKLTREQCVTQLLDNKKMKELKKLSDKAIETKKTL